MRKRQKDPAEMITSFCRLIRDVIESEGFCKMRAYKKAPRRGAFLLHQVSSVENWVVSGRETVRRCVRRMSRELAPIRISKSPFSTYHPSIAVL